MVYVRETLTLIILARDITWHLKRRESCLVEVVSTLSRLSVWRERVKNIAGAAGATIKAVSSS